MTSKTTVTTRIRIISVCITFLGLFALVLPHFLADQNSLEASRPAIMRGQMISAICFLIGCIGASTVYVRARTDPKLHELAYGRFTQMNIAFVNGSMAIILFISSFIP